MPNGRTSSVIRPPSTGPDTEVLTNFATPTSNGAPDTGNSPLSTVHCPLPTGHRTPATGNRLLPTVHRTPSTGHRDAGAGRYTEAKWGSATSEIDFPSRLALARKRAATSGRRRSVMGTRPVGFRPAPARAPP